MLDNARCSNNRLYAVIMPHAEQAETFARSFLYEFKDADLQNAIHHYRLANEAGEPLCFPKNKQLLDMEKLKIHPHLLLYYALPSKEKVVNEGQRHHGTRIVQDYTPCMKRMEQLSKHGPVLHVYLHELDTWPRILRAWRPEITSITVSRTFSHSNCGECPLSSLRPLFDAQPCIRHLAFGHNVFLALPSNKDANVPLPSVLHLECHPRDLYSNDFPCTIPLGAIQTIFPNLIVTPPAVLHGLDLGDHDRELFVSVYALQAKYAVLPCRISVLPSLSQLVYVELADGRMLCVTQPHAMSKALAPLSLLETLIVHNMYMTDEIIPVLGTLSTLPSLSCVSIDSSSGFYYSKGGQQWLLALLHRNTLPQVARLCLRMEFLSLYDMGDQLRYALTTPPPVQRVSLRFQCTFSDTCTWQPPTRIHPQYLDVRIKQTRYWNSRPFDTSIALRKNHAHHRAWCASSLYIAWYRANQASALKHCLTSLWKNCIVVHRLEKLHVRDVIVV